MTLIKRLDYVTYKSASGNDVWFTGQVMGVHDDRAVIQHERRPHYTTIRCHRLMILGKKPSADRI